VGGACVWSGHSLLALPMTDPLLHPHPFALPGYYLLVQRMETALGLPPGFSRALLEEDDWSFIIKLHAVLEAAVTIALIEHLGGTSTLREPDKSVARLSMRSKIALSLSLGVFEDAQRVFLTNLSELRNSFVHRLENITVSLSERLSLMQREKAAFVQRLAHPIKPDARMVAFILEQPKVVIWNDAFLLLCMLRMHIDGLHMSGGQTGGGELENLAQIIYELPELAKRTRDAWTRAHTQFNDSTST
jgi:hypothetical protein